MATFVAWFAKASLAAKQRYAKLTLSNLDKVFREYYDGAADEQGPNNMKYLYIELTSLQKRGKLPELPTDPEYWSSNLPPDEPKLLPEGTANQDMAGQVFQTLAAGDKVAEHRYRHVRKGMVGPFPFESLLAYYAQLSGEEQGNIRKLMGNKSLKALKGDFERLMMKNQSAASRSTTAAQNIASLYQLFSEQGLREQEQDSAVGTASTKRTYLSSSSSLSPAESVSPPPSPPRQRQRDIGAVPGQLDRRDKRKQGAQSRSPLSSSSQSPSSRGTRSLVVKLRFTTSTRKSLSPANAADGQIGESSGTTRPGAASQRRSVGASPVFNLLRLAIEQKVPKKDLHFFSRPIGGSEGRIWLSDMVEWLQGASAADQKLYETVTYDSLARHFRIYDSIEPLKRVSRQADGKVKQWHKTLLEPRKGKAREPVDVGTYAANLADELVTTGPDAAHSVIYILRTLKDTTTRRYERLRTKPVGPIPFSKLLLEFRENPRRIESLLTNSVTLGDLGHYFTILKEYNGPSSLSRQAGVSDAIGKLYELLQ